VVERSHRPVVLAVEDEPLILMIAVDMILDAGFEPLWASNADEAISILESRDDIRIVFTDINMPGSMDGINSCKQCGDDGLRLRSSSRLGSAGAPGARRTVSPSLTWGGLGQA
jgi:CheY-like chemotaxis protein